MGQFRIQRAIVRGSTNTHGFVDGSEAEAASITTHQSIELHSSKRHNVKIPIQQHVQNVVGTYTVHEKVLRSEHRLELVSIVLHLIFDTQQQSIDLRDTPSIYMCVNMHTIKVETLEATCTSTESL